ncbi:hypothetical protein LCGC14_0925300 [marine sediment metagenome]|uniref:Uncharacterized protein n=1 Tax=marine sediment metagenome TaxID=412755 RepID=A0A0F9NUE9_9ZZZZ
MTEAKIRELLARWLGIGLFFVRLTVALDGVAQDMMGNPRLLESRRGRAVIRRFRRRYG